MHVVCKITEKKGGQPWIVAKCGDGQFMSCVMRLPKGIVVAGSNFFLPQHQDSASNR